jgi:uncharacterized membrane protein YfcA
VSIQALFLSLTAIVRPTSLAALFAIMSTRHPRRLLVCYLLAGLSFSVCVGVVVVFALGEWSGWGRSRTDHPVLDVVFGCCFLVYALVIVIRRPKTDDVTPPRPAALMGRVTAKMSPAVAALTGVITHLPGLVYLAALNAIASTQTKPVGQVLQVLLYNAVWFSLTIVALVLSVYRPSASRELLDRVGAGARRYHAPILSGCFGVLGAYLVVVGTSALVDGPW